MQRAYLTHHVDDNQKHTVGLVVDRMSKSEVQVSDDHLGGITRILTDLQKSSKSSVRHSKNDSI